MVPSTTKTRCHSRRYPVRPLVGIGALIIEGDAVLLVKRAREPQKGRWSLPGGLLKVGETVLEGVRREVMEETGLIVEPLQFFTVFERIERDEQGRVEYHYVLLDYICRVMGGQARPGDDVADLVWVKQTDLNNYQLTEGTLPVIHEAFEFLKRQQPKSS